MVCAICCHIALVFAMDALFFICLDLTLERPYIRETSFEMHVCLLQSDRPEVTARTLKSNY